MAIIKIRVEVDVREGRKWAYVKPWTAFPNPSPEVEISSVHKPT
jgi:hypothetical protein